MAQKETSSKSRRWLGLSGAAVLVANLVLTGTTIAEEFYVNPEYLGKIYKRETGKNLKDAVSEYRIQKARELLSHPNIRIGEIAMEVGFDSFAYFSTLFKKYTGTTPNEYRKNLNVETKED